jgi:hypothetical protein
MLSFGNQGLLLLLLMSNEHCPYAQPYAQPALSSQICVWDLRNLPVYVLYPVPHWLLLRQPLLTSAAAATP